MEELTKEDKQILLSIVNGSTFKGADIELISKLKAKLEGVPNG